MMTDFNLSNTRFGRYEIQERIGRGGMAQVFKAFDTNLERVVAIKVLHDYLSDDPTFKERFEREAKFVASFNHPHIVQIYDFDSVERGGQQLYYMVMPYIPGHTLRDELMLYMEQGQLMPRERVLQVALNLADALDYAHKRGMVHRDVKPGNILFDERDQAVLTDFGIARLVVGSNLTQDGLAVGTPAYMSPEQAAGEAVDARSDLYALGIILYEMLTGKPPFHDDGSISILLKHLNEPVPSLSKFIPVPNPQLDAVVMRALAKTPEERYQTAREFAEDLKAVFSGEQVSAVVPPKAEFKVNPPPDRQTRLTKTIQQMTTSIEVVTRSPLGILIAGLLIIGFLVGVTFLTRTNAAVDELSGVNSMTGDTQNLYFTSSFADDDPTRMLWSTGEDGLVSRQFTGDNAYFFINRRVGRAVTSIIDSRYRYEDATISLEAALQPESNDASGYGIVFRYQDEDNYYVFAVDGLGRYSIWIRSDGQWRELRGLNETWTPDDRIKPRGEVNKLTVDVAGNRFIGYVNSELLVDITDDTIPSGGAGVYLATTNDENAQAAVRVTHYSVKDIAESMTTSMTGSEDGSPGRDLR
jgi:serine/threonine protein kinase